MSNFSVCHDNLNDAVEHAQYCLNNEEPIEDWAVNALIRAATAPKNCDAELADLRRYKEITEQAKTLFGVNWPDAQDKMNALVKALEQNCKALNQLYADYAGAAGDSLSKHGALVKLNAIITEQERIIAAHKAQGGV